jgi:hypothetical protein
MMRSSSATSHDPVDDRLAAKHDLIAAGLASDDAESWCVAWQDEAKRQRVRSDSQYFWAAGRGWIDAQRSSPVLPTAPRERQGPPVFSIVRS